jgi:hypothetical protein
MVTVTVRPSEPLLINLGQALRCPCLHSRAPLTAPRAAAWADGASPQLDPVPEESPAHAVASAPAMPPPPPQQQQQQEEAPQAPASAAPVTGVPPPPAPSGSGAAPSCEAWLAPGRFAAAAAAAAAARGEEDSWCGPPSPHPWGGCDGPDDGDCGASWLPERGPVRGARPRLPCNAVPAAAPGHKEWAGLADPVLAAIDAVWRLPLFAGGQPGVQPPGLPPRPLPRRAPGPWPGGMEVVM